jgi:sulfatase maturation enzyme AslB (radical SAM superfamily)
MDCLVPLAKELIPLGVKMNVGLINFTTQQFKIADGKTMGLWPKDLEHLSEVIDEALELGKQHPDFFAALSSEWKTWAIEYFKDPKGENIPCSIGYHKIYIDPHGWVYPCWQLDPTGNVREHSIREILASEKHRHTLHNMLRLNCPGCSCNTYSNRFNHLPRVLGKRAKAVFSAVRKEQGPRGFDNLVES